MFENNKLLHSLLNEISNLGVELLTVKDSILDHVMSTEEVITNIPNEFGRLEYNLTGAISTNAEEIQNALEDTKRIPLMIYEDISKFKNDTDKDFTEVKKKLSQITWLGDRIHEVMDGIARIEESLSDLEVAEDPEETEEIAKLKADYRLLVSQNHALESKIVECNKRNDELENTIRSLSDSFAMVTQGIYNQDSIEFAAVKTYREGWRYLCHNGRQITDFDGIDEIDLSWDKSDKYIRMNISFQGE